MVRKRNISKQVVEQLTEEFQAKTRLVDKLRQENTELQSKQEILLAFYDILKILQQQKSINPDLSTAAEQLLMEQLNGLPQLTSITPTDANGSSFAPTSVSLSSKDASRAEAAAVRRQDSASAGTSNEASAANSSSSGDSGDAAEDEAQLRCAAPPGDPLYIFKSALCRPQLVQEGISITIEELQADAIKTVKELSYLLYQYEKGTYKTAYAADDPARPQPLKEMRDVLKRRFQLVCLAGFGKGRKDNFVLAYVSMPFDGSGKAAGPQAVNRALYTNTVQQLDLTMEQMDRILLGPRAFRGILDRIDDELNELLQHVAAESDARDAISKDSQQQQHMGSAATPPDAAAACAKAENLMSAFSSLYKHLGNSSERSSKLQRLGILLNKTVLVRTTLSTYVFGCMNALQHAKAFVGVSPHPLLVVPFCNAVAEHRKQLLEQQQQQAAATSNSKNKPEISAGKVSAAQPSHSLIPCA